MLKENIKCCSNISLTDYEDEYFNGSAKCVSFNLCKFTNIDFSNARFRGCVFIGCIFNNCKFNNATISLSVLRDCKFIDCDLNTIDYSGYSTFQCCVGLEGWISTMTYIINE